MRKSMQATLDALRVIGGTVSAADLASAMGANEHTVRYRLRTLESYGLAVSERRVDAGQDGPWILGWRPVNA